MAKNVNYRDFKALGIVILVLIPYFEVTDGHSNDKEKKCAILYSEENYAGEKYVLNDRDRSLNLAEDPNHGSHQNGWNTTGSVKIENGCSIEMCNDAYFGGNCNQLEAGNFSKTTLLNVTNSQSVECTCAKECKCSDIFMKKSSCARAYFKGGCSTCHSLYTDLDGSREFFPEFKHISSDIESLRLRKGCKLTVYSEEDFEGDQQIIDSEIVEDFKGTIGSHECECDDTKYQPRVHPPRPDSYPPLIDIPNTLDEVIKMLSNETYSKHPGLQGAFHSLRNRRSSRNAYILLLGATGAGKSSAINLLFDNPKVTKVGGHKSTTTDIHEFRIPVPIDELGVANSELRVIDTPGLGDTRGMEQDAKFLATLDSFLANHEELKNRIPNVVLVFHKFNDNRFDGEGSNFVKMLRGFDDFHSRITDENYSNVIFVLSHFCSESKANQKRPEKLLGHFKKVIQDYSTFPKPILLTVAENKAKEQEIPMINGYFKLPNSEYYPRNLFDKLNIVTKNGKDTIGQGVFTTAFRDSEDFNVTSHTFKLVDKGSNKVQYYIRLLSEALIGVNKTEISLLLQDVWERQVPVSIQKDFSLSLPYLQKALNIKNINTQADIPKTSTAILALLTSIKQDDGTRILLEKALNIKPPSFKQNVVAGFSYNVFKDAYLPFSPLKMGDLEQSDIGFLIPKMLTCNLKPGEKEIFEVFNNTEKYLEQRLHDLGIEGTISHENFTGIVKPGHNIEEISFKNDSCSLSATREFRLFEFVLNERLVLTDEFKTIVKNLPPFNETDHENVVKWTQFFNDYGTHVVKSVYGGGAIEIQLHSDKPYNADVSRALFDLVKFAEDMSFVIDDDGNGTFTSRKTVLKEGTSHSLTFIGGDSNYHTADLTQMSVEEANNLITSWKKSLRFNPAVLNTEMKLVPMSHIVRKLGQNYSSEIDRATSLLFKSKLRYVPSKYKEEETTYSRQDTHLIIEQTNKRIEELMIRNQQMDMDIKNRTLELEQKRLDWEKEKVRLDNEFKINQAKAKEDQDQRDLNHTLTLEKMRLDHEALMANRENNFKLEQQKAKYEAEKRRIDLEHLIRPKPSTGGGGGGRCLKEGTKILMADFSERNVESLKMGDMILDKDFIPSRVIGVSYEFLIDEKLYGFGDDPPFFTKNHLFVGPSEVKSNSEFKLFAQSTSTLYQENPLMEYFNVTEVGNNDVPLFHMKKSPHSLDTIKVPVFEDPQIYPMDTPVYYIQVESISGTYIANGYVCRHDLPPMEYWSNTMSLLLRFINTPSFERMSKIKYTLPVVRVLDDITDQVAVKVQEYFQSEMESSNKQSLDKGFPLMTLGDVDMEQCIPKLFSNPSVSFVGVRLYAKVGVILAPHLDGTMGTSLSESDAATQQHKLYNVIINELDRLVEEMERYINVDYVE